MIPDDQVELRDQIFAKAQDLGASLVGVADVASLQSSPSHVRYQQSPYYGGFAGVEWPAAAKSVLVLALRHRPSEPELDWWGDIPGMTPGNYRLIKMATGLKEWLGKELGIASRPLPYQVEEGGILLKDAAVLAGLGIIGRSNLLITSEYGPCVRLRGLYLDTEVEPTGPVVYRPCDNCDMFCRQTCPQNAFQSGSYSRTLCSQQMSIDYGSTLFGERWGEDDMRRRVIKYCRACELACPIGRKRV